ncbi:serine--tRNA ligase [Loigolactobacillus backii]|uniref:Serine--tRNA ligase n=1 Tax=Loigolactobacillus backii TaxID=375175 RepID=A0A192H0U0_9LACO|nr:serine--tRNA ligase [Loigolactobacillus backii]ANK61571.1 serine--tRNA ligase [Loigolactobacillus backii]ANK69231.1 serine--tRNA ligase [Loigolactobacillus backii]MDA5388767.1 serine--tRNA ligase [Loigolactobacillus backii]MDA5391259.1 serine--tRNA ligase [Loigolactobacillus backii]PIO82105.1 serine--tRNA ligase [Loigolactobacillus backii]
MINPKIIRKNPDMVKAKLKTRGIEAKEIDQYLAFDQENRDAIAEAEDLRKQKNQLTGQISQAKDKRSEETQAKIKQVKTLNNAIKAADEKQKKVYAQWRYIAIRLPNLPDDSLPIGPDEAEDKELRKWGTIPEFDFEPKAHWEIGENLGILDFDRAAKVSGARFVYYKDAGARLERALYNFMLDLHTQKQGYHEIIPPYLVTGKTMFGTGQFPKFTEDVYTVESTGMTLIPTAEVPLTNYYSGEILDEKDLPTYFTALTPAFRSEAGSAGRDTRGLTRMHQFNKVEMVKFCKPEDSYKELDSLTANAQEVLEQLGLAYHVIVLSTGDTGFSSAKTFDLEVWMPEQNIYREISSCSNCLDFQARRAMIRYRKEDGSVDYVHTLNGSGVAVGRTVAAILENYQQADGSVKVPDVLVKYMNGMTVIK